MAEQDNAVTGQEQDAPVADTGVATGSEDTSSTATDAENSGDATDAGSSGQQQAGKESSFPKEKIDEITKLRSRSREEREARIRAEAERDLYRRQAEEKQRAPTQQAPAVRASPRPEDYSDPDEFRAAQFNHAVETAVSNTLSQERAKLKRDSTLQSFTEREAAAAEKYADYTETTRDPTINQVVTPVMAEAILESDVGPDLHYYLAKHRSEALRIAQMSPVAAVRAIGRLEEKLSLGATNTPAQSGKPPAPFRPVSGTSRVESPVEKMSMDEYAAHWEKERAAGRI